MARNAQPGLTHRSKDLCTIEQASYIAQQAILQAPVTGEGSVMQIIARLTARVAELEKGRA